tara:strand:- start:1469 stop:1879 length:411 start_codon:yes stop_codon:yes gene_type:complete
MNKLFNSIKINIASPESIKKLGQRFLSNRKSVGEITTSKNINIRTAKPEIGGLFCERIFGPIKSDTTLRRDLMGIIKLSAPVTHIWYAKVRPSRIASVLGLSVIDLEQIIYFKAYIVIHPGKNKKYYRHQLIDITD